MSTKAIFGTALAAIAVMFSNAMAQCNNSNYTVSLNSLTSSQKALDMVYVQGGTYQRGCTTGDNTCEATEKPPHNVTLSDYYIGKYEVTNAQWKAVMKDNTTADNKPKTSITWYDAIAFTCSLSVATNRKYRLATDAEFEYAARGGKNKSSFLYSGSNTANDVAWTSANSGNGYGAKDVGTKTANALGIYDMSGNVYEWTHDSWGNYNSSATDLTNPIDRPTTHTQKTRRGGSYDQPASESRVSARKIRSIEGKDGSIGFRLALSVSNSDPAAQINPCALKPPPITGGKISFRDERLITANDEVWLYDLGAYSGQPMAYAIKLQQNGSAIATLIMNGSVMGYGDFNVSGEWFTTNNFSLYIVPTSGSVKKYIYYSLDDSEISLMPDGGQPGRFERRKTSDYNGASKINAPTIASPKTPDALATAQGKTNANMTSPPTSVQDSRLIEGSGSAWVQDNVALNAGGTHRYRKDFDSQSDMRFVVWDAAAGSSTLLARGQWFTVDNTFLRVSDPNGATYDYLYSVNETNFYHISYQSYERGDFRMFEKMSASNVPQWKEPTSNTTYNQGASTYIPPSNTTPSSSSKASISIAGIDCQASGSSSSSSNNGGSSSSLGESSSSEEEGDDTAILSQIAVSNQATLMKNGMNLHTVNGATVEIYNIRGKLISRQNYAGGIYSLSFANMPKGMYIAKVRFGSSKAKILRVPVM
jgi:formylglycine-generating enzyme required for sulfatase activity